MLKFVIIFFKKKFDNLFNKKKINKKKFDLISSFAMFYDVENPNKFCKDIFSLLNKDGVWILEHLIYRSC